MGFIPKFFRIKTLCLLGIGRIDEEEAIGNVQMDANSKKAMPGVLQTAAVLLYYWGQPHKSVTPHKSYSASS